jgi:hypothetical protein
VTQCDASGRFLVSRRTSTAQRLEALFPGTRFASLDVDAESLSLFQLDGDSRLIDVHAADARRRGLRSAGVAADRLRLCVADSECEEMIIKGPAFTSCSGFVVSPYYSGARIFSVER